MIVDKYCTQTVFGNTLVILILFFINILYSDEYFLQPN